MQFVKKTSYGKNILRLYKVKFIFVVIIVLIFLLNKIDFPTPNKEINKIIPNENFKIVK